MTTDFESDLRAKMAGIKPALPPGLAQEVVQSHRRHQQSRRRASRALMAVVPAAALIAGGAAVAAHGAGRASPAATHTAVLTAEYVKEKVEGTLGSANGIVEITGDGFIAFNSTGSRIAMVSGTPGASQTNWIDLVTGSQEGATATETTWAIGKQPNVKFVTVDTAAKTVYNGATALMEQSFASPSQLRRFLAANQLTLAGQSDINGQSMVDLRLSSNGAGSVDYWVNAQTFQVAKFVVTLGKSTSFTTYYHWLPRTKSLVAQVNAPRIPAGYRQVDVPAGDRVAGDLPLRMRRQSGYPRRLGLFPWGEGGRVTGTTRTSLSSPA